MKEKRCVAPVALAKPLDKERPHTRATRHETKPSFGLVRGRPHKLRLAEAPPHPNLLPASGAKERACARGKNRSQSRFATFARFRRALCLLATETPGRARASRRRWRPARPRSNLAKAECRGAARATSA